jgi:phthalate 4,5-dioxygenase oxygenase subunit
VEDGGLKCIYHGWLYDIRGRVIDMPGKRRVEHGSGIRSVIWPIRARNAGVIFAYMGPGEPPLVPNYEFLTAPDERVYTRSSFRTAIICRRMRPV